MPRCLLRPIAPRAYKRFVKALSAHKHLATVRLDPDVSAEIEQAARVLGTTKSAAVALAWALARNAWQSPEPAP